MSSSKTRNRNLDRLKEAGVYEAFQEAGLWHTARDYGKDRLEKEINNYKSSGRLPVKMPSDLPKKIRAELPENYKQLSYLEAEEFIKKKKAPPPKPERPEGTVIAFWTDITKRGRKSRYPQALQELKEMKQAMRKQDPEAILKKIFGEKGSKENPPRMFDDKGKVGDIEVFTYFNERQLEEIKKANKGSSIIYHGNGVYWKPLLIGLAGVVEGVYNAALTRAAARQFINAIKRINPGNGKKLDDLYKKYYKTGYYEE